MILCVNLNAAIDKTIVVDSFQLGHIHRPIAVKSLAGGKGCNVARALKTLGEEPLVMGWVGGTSGQFIENELREEGINTDFVSTGVESRTCTSILDTKNQVLTEIYELGNPVPPDKVRTMLDRFRDIVRGATAVTLSGSLPPGVHTDFYTQLINIAHEAKVPTYLDSSKASLLHGAAAKPFLIKPNEKEVAILAQRDLNDFSELIAATKDISARYESIVVLSLGKDGALAAQNGTIVRVVNPPVEAKSAVGSGDCMLAGLVVGFNQDLGLLEAVKFGVAVGTANTMCIGAGQFSMRDFADVLSKIVVENLPSFTVK